MDEKYKQIIDSLKQSAKVELEYSKLTLSEKLSILLSRGIIVLVMIIFAACALFLLEWGLTHRSHGHLYYSFRLSQAISD